MGQQISYLTVIVEHSTVHLMHHNHCQITTINFILLEFVVKEGGRDRLVKGIVWYTAK